jgi:hypothetical protein
VHGRIPAVKAEGEKVDGANKDDSKNGVGLCKCTLSAFFVYRKKYINKPTAGLCVNLESFSVSIPSSN